ncbi:hypothetical protein PPL_06206 [Heterostelium album PN500]|uniref:Uncharacterized protein n=1 Tax=Heterostelium pallidum (strain ATCC 26659 / Pp 5 / PN500) TaxID=670386 RepID=D3BCI1_HETP5|nr:hypothetical protein PPL_06206 [Heterostelium album PN500]EFA80971.1 hypothetical protein PPL_06206 [Heterostelium album PN500]|eukprot:XP_020433089.1 hypothetical protein PPL_06206 [Heterostelium album PN500]
MLINIIKTEGSAMPMKVQLETGPATQSQGVFLLLLRMLLTFIDYHLGNYGQHQQQVEYEQQQQQQQQQPNVDNRS